MDKWSLKISLAVHLLALCLLAGGPRGCGEGNAEQQSGEPEKSGSIIPKSEKDDDKPKEPEPIEVTLIVKPKKKQVDADNAVKECKGEMWYGGIGIVHSDFGDRGIETVAPGYPADRAGIKPGDRILNYARSQIRGEPGTEIILLIERGGQTITFRLIREKICIDP